MDTKAPNKTGTDIIIHPDAVKMTTPPGKRSVYILNDDYTPIEYVYLVLMNDFKLSSQTAIEGACEVHFKGKTLAGEFFREEAEMRRDKVIMDAQKHHHPLRATLE